MSPTWQKQIYATKINGNKIFFIKFNYFTEIILLKEEKTVVKIENQIIMDDVKHWENFKPYKTVNMI
jgi:hypothetical protein